MNILVVHNNNDFFYLIIDVLRISGHMPMKAVDMKDAREILEMERVDLAIVTGDPDNPDGIRFHSFVREFSESPETPFIFVSEEKNAPFPLDASAGDHFMSSANGAISIIEVVNQISPTTSSSQEVLSM